MIGYLVTLLSSIEFHRLCIKNAPSVVVQNLLLWACPTVHTFFDVASLSSSEIEEPLSLAMESSCTTHKMYLLLFTRPS
ncbi:hypothetical protein NL676_011608 [Syzygium grande]|nr:hypothetical protein NL676_011608 [Syzygium grande]